MLNVFKTIYISYDFYILLFKPHKDGNKTNTYGTVNTFFKWQSKVS